MKKSVFLVVRLDEEETIIEGIYSSIKNCELMYGPQTADVHFEEYIIDEFVTAKRKGLHPFLFFVDEATGKIKLGKSYWSTESVGKTIFPGTLSMTIHASNQKEAKKIAKDRLEIWVKEKPKEGNHLVWKSLDEGLSDRYPFD